MIKALVTAASLAAILGGSQVAFACPDCATSDAVRASIRDDPNLAFHLGATVAPYLVLGALVFSIERIGRAPRPSDGRRARRDADTR